MSKLRGRSLLFIVHDEMMNWSQSDYDINELYMFKKECNNIFGKKWVIPENRVDPVVFKELGAHWCGYPGSATVGNVFFNDDELKKYEMYLRLR